MIFPFLFEMFLVIPLLVLACIIGMGILKEHMYANGHEIIGQTLQHVQNVTTYLYIGVFVIVILVIVVSEMISDKKKKEALPKEDGNVSFSLEETLCNIKINTENIPSFLLEKVMILQEEMTTAWKQSKIENRIEEIHSLERMKTELDVLLETYREIRVEKQEETKVRMEEMVLHMKREVKQIQKILYENKEKEFEKHMRTLESKYKQSEYL